MIPFRHRAHRTAPRLPAADPSSGSSTASLRPRSRARATAIDDLPVTIRSHILSFVPTETAVQTTVIGRAWRDVWLTAPVMDLNMYRFHCRIGPDEPARSVQQRFSRFVSAALHQRPATNRLRKFKLYFCFGPNATLADCVTITSWLWKAIGSKAVELDLDLQSLTTYEGPRQDVWNRVDQVTRHNDDVFVFQFCQVIDSSVEVLKLRDCNFSVPEKEVKNIKELQLQSFHSSDAAIESLMAVLVNLEDLSIVDGQGLVNLKIVSQKLKRFRLDGFNPFREGAFSVEIRAPMLESITLWYVFASRFVMTDSPALVEASVKYAYRGWWEFVRWTGLVGSLRGVRSLSIQNMWPWTLSGRMYEPAENLKDIGKRRPKGAGYVAREYVKREYLMKLQQGVESLSDNFEFPNLKHLELLTGYCKDDIRGLEILLKKCPQLETLALFYKYVAAQDDKPSRLKCSSFNLHIPCLRLVTLKNFGSTRKELFVIKLLRENGVENIVTTY